MKSKIDKIGFEIEGEFSDSLYSFLSGKGIMKGDGSIRSCPSNNKWHEKHGFPSLSRGEYVSYPIRYKDRKEIVELLETLQEYYKKGKFHFNDSMGFHVHVSFKPERPPELISSKFWKYFLDGLKKKFPKEYKLRKGNSYCKVNIGTDIDRFIHKGSGRYSAINYRALIKHRTIEFRIFPAETPKKMLSYLTFVINEVNLFLKKDFGYKFNVAIKDEETIMHKRTASLNNSESCFSVPISFKSRIKEINSEAKLNLASEEISDRAGILQIIK